MHLLYFYDLKPENPSEYNKLKRRFYYAFNKLGIPDLSWKTKSVFIIPPKYELIIDHFFLSFKPDVEVYKVHAKFIEEL